MVIGGSGSKSAHEDVIGSLVEDRLSGRALDQPSGVGSGYGAASEARGSVEKDPRARRSRPVPVRHDIEATGARPLADANAV